MNYYFLMFDQFESLDLFGPVEIFARTPDASLHYISMDGGMITSAQGAVIIRRLPDHGKRKHLIGIRGLLNVFCVHQRHHLSSLAA